MVNRLVFVVDVDSGDPETDRDYLEMLQRAFVAVTDLQKWGYTQDELLCRSTWGNKEDAPEMQVAENFFEWSPDHDNDGQLLFYTGMVRE